MVTIVYAQSPSNVLTYVPICEPLRCHGEGICYLGACNAGLVPVKH